MLKLNGLDEVRAQAGKEVGVSEWHEVTQDTIDRFAEVTGDHQWIHVDPERAKAESPFGSTIAHGYYTLALAPVVMAEVVEFGGIAFAVNYGLNKVRFPAPVPVGSKVRARVAISQVQDVPGGVQASLALTFEREGGDKPVCAAESLVRLYAGD